MVSSIGVITIFYHLLPYRKPRKKKPLVTFFPKYRKIITLPDELSTVESIVAYMSKSGFHKKSISNNRVIFHKGNPAGDFSLALARITLIVLLKENRKAEFSIRAGWVILIDTGGFWQFFKNLVPEKKTDFAQTTFNGADFWQIIDHARDESINTDQFLTRLEKKINMLDPESIRKFDQIFNQEIQKLNRWELWALAYIVRTGCSDDSFDYFKGWLISKGEQVCRVMQEFNPIHYNDKISDLLKNLFNEDPQLEEIFYLAGEVYEKKTGQRLEPLDVDYKEISGKEWSEENLSEEYHRLCVLFNYPNLPEY